MGGALCVHRVVVPVRIVSEANKHESAWLDKWRRGKAQKSALSAHLLAARVPKGFLRDRADKGIPVRVHLVRLGPKLQDGDNRDNGLKACRDLVAKYGGVDDGDRRVRWTYDGQVTGPDRYALVVEVWEGEVAREEVNLSLLAADLLRKLPRCACGRIASGVRPPEAATCEACPPKGKGRTVRFPWAGEAVALDDAIRKTAI